MLFLGLVPRSRQHARLAELNDKYLHAGCFCILSVLAILVWELEDLSPEMDLDTRTLGSWEGVLKTGKRLLRTKVGVTSLAMFAAGWGSEIVQEVLSPVSLLALGLESPQ